jgi:hypothetical protein
MGFEYRIGIRVASVIGEYLNHNHSQANKLQDRLLYVEVCMSSIRNHNFLIYFTLPALNKASSYHFIFRVNPVLLCQPFWIIYSFINQYVELYKIAITNSGTKFEYITFDFLDGIQAENIYELVDIP